MAAIQIIDLDEKDVPGAKFVHTVPEDHTNIQLKRWLKCRGLLTSGKRHELIKRCNNAAYVKIDPSIDCGKWIELKAQNNSKQATTVPILPIFGWKAFPSASIPKHFNYGHIYHHLVESVSAIDNVFDYDTLDDDEDDVEKDDVHTSKPFTKGKHLFRSGHVKNMQDTIQRNYYFIKADVQASYSSIDYNTTITISLHTGMVKEGTCACGGSGMGRCAHVAALLFALEDYIANFGTEPVTCTQKVCEWNKGRKKNKTPKAVYNTKYASMKKELIRPRNSSDQVLTADPRPTALRDTTVTLRENNDFVSDLQLATGDCGWTNLLDFIYKDFTVQEYGADILKLQCEQLYENLEEMCENKTTPFVISNTEGQATDAEWHSQRHCRVTASIAKNVACVRSGYAGLLHRKLWSKSFSTAALQYGKESETFAFESYKEKHPHLKVTSTGLWVNPKYPQLASSPDGIVEDTVSGETGLLEIKCPYILRHCSPMCARENLSRKQNNNFCCMIMDDDSLTLKRSHSYYYQVQMQLSICEKSFCDFVIWSKHGMSVERINIDTEFWSCTIQRLVSFHKEYLTPEYFLMRVPRQLSPICFKW